MQPSSVRSSSPTSLPLQKKMQHLRSDLWREIRLVTDALRSACLSLVPFLVVVSFVALAEDLTGQRWINAAGYFPGQSLGGSMQHLFPLMLLLALAYHLCVRYDINRIIGMLLALLASLVSGFLHPDVHPALSSFHVLPGDVLHALMIPVLSIRLLCAYRQALVRLETRLPAMIWSHMAESLQLILPFLLALLTVLLLAWLCQPVALLLHDSIQTLLYGLGDTTFMFVRMILAHALWTLGLHGDNLLGLMYDTKVLFQPLAGELNHIGFYNLFVLYGGCGGALSLWIAVLIGSRDGHGRKVALLASPFVFFNIPEILIFGLPVVLNPSLLLPFFLVPMLNFLLGIAAVHAGWLSFTAAAPSWTTPVFLNSYLASGDWSGPLLQLFSISLGVLVYLPFVRRFSNSQSSSHQLRRLEQSLNISSSLQARSGMQFHTAQASIIHSHTEVDKIIQMLEHNQLEVHYQPKVNIQTMRCDQHEALLRLRLSDGSLRGPYFLQTLEQAGLAGTIDLWVCRTVRQTIQQWASQDNFRPHIAINLHPDTIQDFWFIERIADELTGLNVDFEIIERADVSTPVVLENLAYLRERGFRIALDDFGTGYAGFGSLNLLPLDVIKLDKSLLDATDSAEGRIVYQLAAEMCNKLGLECVAEGVETHGQLDTVRQAGVRYVQGYLLSKPLSQSDLVHFKAQ